ncbi:hypothetical protein CTAYLR_003860 [Chrysophaeum taylorii]|uniref:NYN domain-containing protein n=1 Tax=Chrysophaeum taylorii TaxID=2483200 RepID=A0AAD7UMM4_9STRA|nr:hypothetical protein CTAYLR_003860 [Chrysophaeum taylorii]
MAGQEMRDTEACAVFWDLENCQVGRDASPVAVVANLKKQLRQYGQLKLFRAYADLSTVKASHREELQLAGVALHDIPGHRKDAADKAIVVDMLCFAIDYRSPATLVLVSGDRDLGVVVSRLSDRGYRVVLVHPSDAQLSPILRSVVGVCIPWAELQQDASGTLIAANAPTSAKAEQSTPSSEPRSDSTIREDTLPPLIAEKISGSKVHKNVLKTLEAKPDGCSISKVMKNTNLGGMIEHITASSTPQWLGASIGVVNPRLVLSHLPGVQVRKVNSRNLVFLDADVRVPRPQKATLKKELDLLRLRLLQHQLLTGQGAMLPEVEAMLGEFPQFVNVREENLAVALANTDCFRVEEGGAIHTNNFAEQQLAYSRIKSAMSERLEQAPEEGLTWEEFKACVKSALEPEEKVRSLANGGHAGIAQALIEHKIVSQPVSQGNFFPSEQESANNPDDDDNHREAPSSLSSFSVHGALREDVGGLGSLEEDLEGRGLEGGSVRAVTVETVGARSRLAKLGPKFQSFEGISRQGLHRQNILDLLRVLSRPED